MSGLRGSVDIPRSSDCLDETKNAESNPGSGGEKRHTVVALGEGPFRWKCFVSVEFTDRSRLLPIA